MGWRTIVVNTHSKLSYKNNHLIFKDASRTELIHLSEVDILLLETTDIVLSTMLIKRLVDEGGVEDFRYSCIPFSINIFAKKFKGSRSTQSSEGQ